MNKNTSEEACENFLSDLAQIIETKYGILNIKREWKGDQRFIHARIEFAKKAHEKGVPQKHIASFLGHADHSTVSRYIRSDSGKVRPDRTDRPKKRSKKTQPALYNKIKSIFKRLL